MEFDPSTLTVMDLKQPEKLAKLITSVLNGQLTHEAAVALVKRLIDSCPGALATDCDPLERISDMFQMFSFGVQHQARQHAEDLRAARKEISSIGAAYRNLVAEEERADEMGQNPTTCVPDEGVERLTERNQHSRFVVSYWIIPGGYRYDVAYCVAEFFSTQIAAERAADEIGRMPPEMAYVCTIEDWDRAENNNSRQSPVGGNCGA